MIAVDASALVAIAQGEAGWKDLLRVLDRNDENVLAPMNYVEAGIVVIHRGILADRRAFDNWLAGLGVDLRHDLELGPSALDAYLRFGKGRHPARLNLGDCFAYALAKALDAPLLYRGDNFSQTDIRSAL